MLERSPELPDEAEALIHYLNGEELDLIGKGKDVLAQGPSPREYILEIDPSRFAEDDNDFLCAKTRGGDKTLFCIQSLP